MIKGMMFAVVAAGALVVGSLATPATAEAGCYGRGYGGGYGGGYGYNAGYGGYGGYGYRASYRAPTYYQAPRRSSFYYGGYGSRGYYPRQRGLSFSIGY